MEKLSDGYLLFIEDISLNYNFYSKLPFKVNYITDVDTNNTVGIYVKIENSLLQLALRQGKGIIKDLTYREVNGIVELPIVIEFNVTNIESLYDLISQIKFKDSTIIYNELTLNERKKTFSIKDCNNFIINFAEYKF